MKTKGFSLIELLVVVAIIAIIAAFAYPSYLEQVRKSRRADAHTALLDAANKQTQFFLDNKAYTTDMTKLGYAADPADSPEGYYKFDAAVGTNPPSFTLTATAQAAGGQNKDKQCFKLSYTHTNKKGSENDAGTDTTNTGDCW